MMTQTQLHKAACFVTRNFGGVASQVDQPGGSSMTTTMTQTQLHKAHSTCSRARPKIFSSSCQKRFSDPTCGNIRRGKVCVSWHFLRCISADWNSVQNVHHVPKKKSSTQCLMQLHSDSAPNLQYLLPFPEKSCAFKDLNSLQTSFLYSEPCRFVGLPYISNL